MKAYARHAIACSIAALSVLLQPIALTQSAQAQEKVKVGFEFFLSGAGAAFGTHARDGAKLMVDALNLGEVPAPYGTYAGWDKAKNQPIIENIKYFDAECVNPPANMTAGEWLKSGFKEAKCN